MPRIVAAPSSSVSCGPAQVQHAVGEDMAALQVAGELDLVDGEECRVGLVGHRLDRTDAVARLRRDDALLAGDERNLVGADPRHDAAVDLGRQQPERQADEPGLMAEHPLDGEVGLSGVGRSKDSDQLTAAGGGVRCRRETHTAEEGSVLVFRHRRYRPM